MLAFEGDRLPDWVERRVRDAPVAGVTLFMAVNVLRPHQVRALTEAFQTAGAGGDGSAPASGPLLVAADQEGGQLIALGAETTPVRRQHGARSGR